MKKLQLYFRYYLKERGCIDYPYVLKLRDPHQLRDPRWKRESRWWDAFMTWEREIKPPVTRRDMWVRWDLGVSERVPRVCVIRTVTIYIYIKTMCLVLCVGLTAVWSHFCSNLDFNILSWTTIKLCGKLLRFLLLLLLLLLALN